MDTTLITAALLDALETSGPAILALVVLMGTVGLPMPSTVLIVAAGAMAREGMLEIPWALGATLAAAVVGDGAGYLLGRATGPAAEARFGGALWQQAAARFARQGWLAVYLSRWLLTPIAVPINVIAGVSAYRAHRFFSAEVAGDVTWVLLYATAGYLLGAQWQVASDLISDYSGWAALATMTSIAAWWGIRQLGTRTGATAIAGA